MCMSDVTQVYRRNLKHAARRTLHHLEEREREREGCDMSHAERERERERERKVQHDAFVCVWQYSCA